MIVEGKVTLGNTILIKKERSRKEYMTIKNTFNRNIISVKEFD